MGQTERIYLLHRLFSTHRLGLGMERIAEALGCAVITVRRDLQFLRDTLRAPLVLEGDPRPKWRYVSKEGEPPFQLPRVWLEPDELYALLFALQLIGGEGKLGLGKLLGPLQLRLEKLLGTKVQRLNRLSVLRVQARRSNQVVFRLVVQAVLDARILEFCYLARRSGKDQAWRVSPQRLIHHRDCWYLDASNRQKGGKVYRFSSIASANCWSPTSPQSTSRWSNWRTPKARATASSPARRCTRRSSCSPTWRRVGSTTSNGIPDSASAPCPTAAWNSPCRTPNPANC